MRPFKEYRFKNNPLEKLIVDSFIEQHGNPVKDMSLIVFGSKDGGESPIDHLTDRERSIVLSTIQWLGSPVGQSFLKSCGFITKTDVKDDE